MGIDKHRVLITGISGFVGRHLTDYLIGKGEFEVVGLDLESAIKSVPVQSYSWENISKVGHVDTVIHLAGIAHDLGRKFSDADYFRVNTKLTEEIYTWFLSSGTNRFIYFSTVKAVRDYSESPLEEDANPEKVGVYGTSKKLAEDFLLAHLPSPGRSMIIFRPCMIHGPQPKGNLVSLHKYITKGLPYPFGRIKNQRSYLSIDNLCFLLERTITTDIPSGIYHLADDTPLSTKRIIELIGETSSTQPLIVNIPVAFINLLAGLGSALNLPFNRKVLKKLAGNFIVSNQKIKNVLTISSLPVSAEEGMKKAVCSLN